MFGVLNYKGIVTGINEKDQSKIAKLYENWPFE
jgi:hypothetical protein